jgi:hypothetical protein
MGMGLALSTSACVGLQPQLQPTDMAAVEQAEDRQDREAMYERERIQVAYDPRGKRYFKGDDPNAPLRGWQSLDAVLRSDANSSAALPERKLRTSRVLFGMAMASSVVMLAGAAATAREGLDTNTLQGPGAVLLAGSGMALGFGIGAGISFGQARKGYEDAVEVYNDSLGLRLGLYDGDGKFIPPAGTLLDEEGFIILEDSLPVASVSAPPKARAVPGADTEPSDSSPALAAASGSPNVEDEAAPSTPSGASGPAQTSSDSHPSAIGGGFGAGAVNLAPRGLTSAATR